MKTTHKEIDTVLSTLQRKLGTSTMLGRMGKKYDAFKVLISTILSARAKDEVTEEVAEELFKKYPDAKHLARAKKPDVAKIIRRIGFYNAKSENIIKSSKIIIEKYKGKIPTKLNELLTLPGVGRKVANCVLVYAFKKDAIPVDIHVHRISNRLGWVKTKTPEETEKELMKLIPKKHWQAVNDTFVTFGKTICTPISPFCSKCPIYKHCKRIGVKRSR
ncbi:endonuclease III [Candidatus Woesearchaeota archaeon]|nr:MAG: endonuclease III [Candidatus Woesearchaeota archaeon]